MRRKEIITLLSRYIFYLLKIQDFVEFLKNKTRTAEDADWSAFSLAQAMRGMMPGMSPGAPLPGGGNPGMQNMMRMLPQGMPMPPGIMGGMGMGQPPKPLPRPPYNL